MSDQVGKIVGMGVSLYIVAYVAIPALQEFANQSALLTGISGSLVGTLVPVLAVIGIAMVFITKKK